MTENPVIRFSPFVNMIESNLNNNKILIGQPIDVYYNNNHGLVNKIFTICYTGHMEQSTFVPDKHTYTSNETPVSYNDMKDGNYYLKFNYPFHEIYSQITYFHKDSLDDKTGEYFDIELHALLSYKSEYMSLYIEENSTTPFSLSINNNINVNIIKAMTLFYGINQNNLDNEKIIDLFNDLIIFNYINFKGYVYNRSELDGFFASGYNTQQRGTNVLKINDYINGMNSQTSFMLENIKYDIIKYDNVNKKITFTPSLKTPITSETTIEVTTTIGAKENDTEIYIQETLSDVNPGYSYFQSNKTKYIIYSYSSTENKIIINRPLRKAIEYGEKITITTPSKFAKGTNKIAFTKTHNIIIGTTKFTYQKTEYKITAYDEITLTATITPVLAADISSETVLELIGNSKSVHISSKTGSKNSFYTDTYQEGPLSNQSYFIDNNIRYDITKYNMVTVDGNSIWECGYKPASAEPFIDKDISVIQFENAELVSVENQSEITVGKEVKSERTTIPEFTLNSFDSYAVLDENKTFFYLPTVPPKWVEAKTIINQEILTENSNIYKFINWLKSTIINYNNPAVTTIHKDYDQYYRIKVKKNDEIEDVYDYFRPTPKYETLIIYLDNDNEVQHINIECIIQTNMDDCDYNNKNKHAGWDRV
jgi:hypothetical protein